MNFGRALGRDEYVGAGSGIGDGDALEVIVGAACGIGFNGRDAVDLHGSEFDFVACGFVVYEKLCAVDGVALEDV